MLEGPSYRQRVRNEQQLRLKVEVFEKSKLSIDQLADFVVDLNKSISQFDRKLKLRSLTEN